MTSCNELHLKKLFHCVVMLLHLVQPWLYSTASLLQGAKREREVSPNVPVSPDAQAGTAATPPAKRVRAPTPVAEPSPVAMEDQRAPTSVVEPTPAASQAQQQAVPPSMSQKPAEERQAPAIMPETDDAPPPQTSEAVAGAAATSVAPQQQHIARVAVTQQDPERVQVKIEMPSSVVHSTNPELPQQLGVAQPAQQMEDVQQMGVAQPAATPIQTAEAVDVDMMEGPANAAKPEVAGDDAEDGELPDADDGEAGEQEGSGAQLQATPAAVDGAAAATAGQGDACDADGNAGSTGRKPIIFNLQGAGTSEPSPPTTGSQPRTSRPPPSGTFRSWACLCMIHLMQSSEATKYDGVYSAVT